MINIIFFKDKISNTTNIHKIKNLNFYKFLSFSLTNPCPLYSLDSYYVTFEIWNWLKLVRNYNGQRNLYHTTYNHFKMKGALVINTKPIHNQKGSFIRMEKPINKFLRFSAPESWHIDFITVIKSLKYLKPLCHHFKSFHF